MVRMATTNYTSSNFLTLALNNASHSTFFNYLQIVYLKMFLFSMLTSTFVFNKASQSSTFTSNTLVIMGRFLDYDINILVFTIGVSIGISMNVVACLDNGFSASLDIRLGLPRLMKRMKWRIWCIVFNDYCLLDTLCVACLCLCLWGFPL